MTEKIESYVETVLMPLYDKITELTQENARLEQALRQCREEMTADALEFNADTDVLITEPLTVVVADLGTDPPALTTAGADYLKAAEKLEHFGNCYYLGWYLNGLDNTWWGSKEDTYLVRCPSAQDLVMAIQTLEQALLTEGAPTEADDHAYERDHRGPEYWRTNQTDLFLETQDQDDERPGEPPEG